MERLNIINNLNSILLLNISKSCNIVFQSLTYKPEKFDDVWIFLEHLDKKYLLSKDCFFYNIRLLYYQLKEVLSYNLLIDDYIQKNGIGMIWNKALLDETSYPIHIIETLQTYRVWSSPSSARPCVTTWLYNYAGKVIIEITPEYSSILNFTNYYKNVQLHKNELRFRRAVSLDKINSWLMQLQKYLDLYANIS